MEKTLHPNSKESFAIPLGLAVVILLVYFQALSAGFIWDDAGHVALKSTLHFPEGLKTIWLTPGATQQYYPLSHSLFWLCYGLWGMHPFGYHLLTVLFHAATAVLFFIFIKKLGFRHAGWIVAAWALHPLQVESVAWISELKNTLSGFFYALALILFFDSLKKEPLARRKYVTAFVAFSLALAAKTTACTWPVIVLLIGLWQSRSWLPLLKKLAPFFALSLAGGLLTIWVEKTHMGAAGEAWTLSAPQHIVLAGRIFWFYLLKLAFPFPQAFIYPRWVIDPHALGQVLYPMAVVGILGGLVLWARRSRGPLIAILMYSATIFPALGFFNLYPMRYSFVADHFQYLAGLPILVMFVEGLSRMASIGTLGRRMRLGFACGLLIVLAWLSWKRTAVYQNPESVWRDVLALNPNSTMAHNNLGIELALQKRPQEAEQHFQAAVASNPDELEAYANLGLLYKNQHRYSEAAASYQQAIAYHPEEVSLRAHSGIALIESGRYAEAIIQLQEAVRLARAVVANSPSWKQESMRQKLAQVEGNLGLAYYQAQRWPESENALLAAVEHDPHDTILRDLLARTLLQRKNTKR